METIEWNVDNICAFYAFESNDFLSEDLKEELYGEIRFAVGIVYNKIAYDTENKIYLYEDSFGYSVLASVQTFATEVTVPVSYNGRKVHTINSWAIYTYADVRIANGVSKIQKYGIITENSVYIPKSVTTINACGVLADGYFLVAAKTKPDDWDTYWNDNDSSVIYDAEDAYIDTTNKILFRVENGKAMLVKYLGSSSTIYIPRKVSNYTVAKIVSGFYTYSYSTTIYVPKEVEAIEAKAFTNSRYNTFSFYFERATQPSNWDTEFYYNSYYDNYTSNITKKWGQTLSY